jgi:uncharacterized protein
MPLSMYDVCVPQVVRTLDAISNIIDKAVAHCAARKVDPAVLVSFRLAADMHPFSRQIQIMTDQAKGCIARLTGSEIPGYADTETTMEELKARIAKTKAFAESFERGQFDGSEDRPLTVKFGPNEMKFPNGLDYVGRVFLPNFYFHATTAYDILRHTGVVLGKRDFLGM